MLYILLAAMPPAIAGDDYFGSSNASISARRDTAPHGEFHANAELQSGDIAAAEGQDSFGILPVIASAPRIHIYFSPLPRRCQAASLRQQAKNFDEDVGRATMLPRRFRQLSLAWPKARCCRRHDIASPAGRAAAR